MIQKKDASVMLKDEIGESCLRLKAAKFGHSIEEIAPQYDKTFYLPDKEKFKQPQTSNFRQRPSNVFIQNEDRTPMSRSAKNVVVRSIVSENRGNRRNNLIKVENDYDSVFMTEANHRHLESQTRQATSSIQSPVTLGGSTIRVTNSIFNTKQTVNLYLRNPDSLTGTQALGQLSQTTRSTNLNSPAEPTVRDSI